MPQFVSERHARSTIMLAREPVDSFRDCYLGRVKLSISFGIVKGAHFVVSADD
jgi:hypothetical protein